MHSTFQLIRAIRIKKIAFPDERKKESFKSMKLFMRAAIVVSGYTQQIDFSVQV